MHTLPYISAYFCQVMHARCGYTGTSRRTAFVDLNDVSRKLKPLEKPPLRFVSYLRNLTKINQTLLAGIIHFFMTNMLCIIPCLRCSGTLSAVTDHIMICD